MEILRSIVSKKDFADLQLLVPFAKRFDAPGAFAPSAKDFEVVIAASNRMNEIFHDNVTSLLTSDITPLTLSSLYAFIKTLKIFSRLGPQALLLAYHKDIFPQIISLYHFIIEQYDALVVQSSSDDDELINNVDTLTKVALFLVLRLEISRLLQNMTIQNRTIVKELILGDHTTTNHIIHIIQHGYCGDHDTINTALLETMFKAQINYEELSYYLDQISIPVIIGLSDLGHLLRAVCYIVSEDNSNEFVQHGLLAALYYSFLEVTSTKINIPGVEPPFGLEFDYFNPYLLQSEKPYTLNIFQSFDHSLLPTKLNPQTQTQQPNDDDQLWYSFRMFSNDISRVLIIFGAMDDDEKYMENFASRCFGTRPKTSITKGTRTRTSVGKQQNQKENDQVHDTSVNTVVADLDVQHDITLFQRFVERLLYILGLGVGDDLIPTEISTPIDKIVSIPALVDNYVVKETNVGYHPHQQTILDNFNTYYSEKKKNQTINEPIEQYNPVSPTIYTQTTSILYIKMCWIKVLCYVPLKYAPFLYLHKHALTFTWNLFIETINTIAPANPNPDGESPRISHIPVDIQNVEIVPSIIILLRILESSYDIETAAQSTMTQEQAIYYFQLGLTPLAETVKKLIFGKYSNFDIDSSHRDVILAQLIAEEEEEKAAIAKIACPDDCECKCPESDQDDTTSSEDSVGCDDFEAFAEEGEDAVEKTPKIDKKDEKQTALDFLKQGPSDTKAGEWKRCLKRQFGPAPNTSMIPAGGLSQSLLDDQNNTSLKARLILLMLTPLNHHISQLIQEMLYTVAYKKSDEFIRLCGFGRAVGLLANKGLPGFGHLTQNAINLDDIIRMKKSQQ